MPLIYLFTFKVDNTISQSGTSINIWKKGLEFYYTENCLHNCNKVQKKSSTVEKNRVKTKRKSFSKLHISLKSP